MSRDESPVRKSRHTTPPIGFRRSCCPLGHACSNSRCYTNISDPKILWDQEKYKHPYYPSKYKHKRSSPSPKGGEEDRQQINTTDNNEDDEFVKYLKKNKKTGVHARERRYKRKERKSTKGRMTNLKDKGFLIPGTEEYKQKIAELQEQGQLPK